MGERGFERKFFERKIGETRKEEREELKKEREPEDDTKGVFLDEATKEIEEKNTEYDKKWFAKEKWKIKKAGYDPKSKDEGYKKMVAEKLGADKDLMKWKYRKEKAKISRLIAVREGVGKEEIKKDEEGKEKREFVPKEFTDIDDWCLALDFLQKRVESKDLVFTGEDNKRIKELEEKKAKPEEKLSEDEQKELEDLSEKKEIFEAEKDLTEKITGRNLEKEADNFVIETDVLRRKLEDLKGDASEKDEELGRLREEASDKDEEARQLKEDASRNKERAEEIDKLLKTKKETRVEQEKSLTKLREMAAEPGIEDAERARRERKVSEASALRILIEDIERDEDETRRLREEASRDEERAKDLAKEASSYRETAKDVEKEISKLQRKISKNEEEISKRETLGRDGFIEGEIKTIAEMPEKAITKFYAREKEKVATDAEMAKVMPKTPEEERELKETFGEKGIDIVTLGQEVLNEKMVKKIKENPEKAIGKFCKERELPFDSKDFGEYSKKITEMGWPREELIKNEGGILALFFGFLYYLILGEQKREEKLGEFFEGLKPKIE